MRFPFVIPLIISLSGCGQKYPAPQSAHGKSNSSILATTESPAETPHSSSETTFTPPIHSILTMKPEVTTNPAFHVFPEPKPLMKSVVFNSVTLEPENQHLATVFLLHGKNGNANSMIDLGRDSWIATLKGNVRFISVGSHPSSWFESFAFDPVAVAGHIAARKEVVDRFSLDATMHKLVSLIDRESQLVGYSKVFLLGYSQGGMVALWTGLMGGRNIGGVVAINSAVPILNIGQVANPGIDVAHFHGLQDRIIPVELARLGRERAGAAGATGYNLIEGPGGHDVSSGTRIAVTEWLSPRVGV